ncbi:hypothetical protein CYMTET_12668 [Cymbomonas tetramitiformis]|uniref:Uncharacterized protein n=1 Tax=Cymbomonas tetramitiformis TaxID=36881 RepID=A0AAE0LBU5_9CHLO|nr:hypothetical protein CYMTET_12668 [Cymbomonas tetramitiformis]
MVTVDTTVAGREGADLVGGGGGGSEGTGVDLGVVEDLVEDLVVGVDLVVREAAGEVGNMVDSEGDLEEGRGVDSVEVVGLVETAGAWRRRRFCDLGRTWRRRWGGW